MKDVQVSASIHAVECKVDLVRREMESINTHINQFKHYFEELFQKPNVPEEFKELKTLVDNFFRNTDSNHISTLATLASIRSTLETVKITIYNHDTEISMFRHAIPVIDQKIDATKDELSQKIVSITTAFSNRFDEHADKQKKQIETFSAQAMKAPNSVIESNTKLVERIEISCIDASNALLKANNIELSVKLLERKLENLSLQVKKSELTQQA